MTEPLEDLLRRARAGGVTYLSIDASGAVARAGAWRAFGHYSTAHNADVAEALREALLKAMAPKPSSTDLTSLLD